MIVGSMVHGYHIPIEAFHKIYKDISTHPECFVNIEEYSPANSWTKQVGVGPRVENIIAVLAIDEDFAKGEIGIPRLLN